MAYFFAQPNPATDLSNRLPLSSRREIGGGLFIPTSVKFAFVTFLLWTGLIGVCASAWIGAFAIGAAFARWMGA